MKRHNFSLKAFAPLLGAAALFALAQMTGPAVATEVSPALAKVLAAAKGEPPLKLMWSGATLGGSKGAKEIQQSMNAAFGSDIEIVFTPGPSFSQMGGRLLTEFKAGTPASADVLLGGISAGSLLAKQGALRAVDWKSLLPGRITDRLVDADGRLLRFASFVSSISYNKELMPNPPRSLADALKPEYKGKIATTPYGVSFPILVTHSFLGEKKGMEYLRKFAGQVGGFMRCGEESRLASGEFLALVLDCGGGNTRVKIAQGAPLATVIPQDFIAIQYFYFGVLKNATSPNAAEAFATFMVTPEGQKLAWDNWYYDLHLFPGSNIAASIAEAERLGGKPIDIDIAWEEDNPGARKLRRKVVNTLRARGK